MSKIGYQADFLYKHSIILDPYQGILSKENFPNKSGSFTTSAGGGGGIG